MPQAPSSSTYKIGLAGCGKMGSAMVRSWLGAGILQSIDILDPHGVPDELLQAKQVSHFREEKSFSDKSGNWDALVIAIKPQSMNEFCGKIGNLPPQLLILSIVAGQTISNFEKQFGADHPIVRSMPNTPASIGKGMTVACANKHVNATQKSIADSLLEKLGQVSWADESKLDAVTALSGSGPAYIFYLIEAMAKAGIDAGLDDEFSMTLARQTVIGAAALAEKETDISAAKLRENVTSPNGTTAAALSVLMDGRFQDIMTEAIAKATTRGKELSQ